jgi:hypothetical protein
MAETRRKFDRDFEEVAIELVHKGRIQAPRETYRTTVVGP